MLPQAFLAVKSVTENNRRWTQIETNREWIRLSRGRGTTARQAANRHEGGTPGALPRFRLREAYGAIRQPPDEADSEARSARSNPKGMTGLSLGF
jgi:hypothetical protein